MKTISQALSTRKETETYANQIKAAPVGKKATSKKKRVKPKKLENIYRDVGLAFNSINKVTQLIMSGNPQLECRSTKVKQYFQDFLEQIGEIGGNEHWDEMSEKIYRYQCIYGQAFVELIFNKQGNKVVDLALLDPKRIDYAKKGHGNKIALDKYGNPFGYVQKLPSSMLGEVENIYEPPKNISLNSNEIYFPREKIAHFKLYTVGEGFYGIGLLEPTLADSQNLYKLKEEYADKAHTTLFPLRYARVGDETHKASPEEMKQILKQLKKAKHSTVMSVPDHVDLDLMEASHPEELINFLNYFGESEISGMGIPKPFATGVGEDVNRATLDKFNQLFELTLKDIVTRTCRTIERQIFKVIAEYENFDEYPKINWGDIGVEEQSNKAERIIEYVKSGILKPDDERVQKAIKQIDEI